jgi:hypothetical protein
MKIEQDVELATSRYQSHELIVASGLMPIRITRGRPRFRLHYELAGALPILAPTSSEFRIEDDERFAATYRSRLDSIGAGVIVEEIRSLSALQQAKGLVLLCFEDLASGPICHRRVFADWIFSEIGWNAIELVNAK